MNSVELPAQEDIAQSPFPLRAPSIVLIIGQSCSGKTVATRHLLSNYQRLFGRVLGKLTVVYEVEQVSPLA